MSQKPPVKSLLKTLGARTPKQKLRKANRGRVLRPFGPRATTGRPSECMSMKDLMPRATAFKLLNAF